MGTLGILGVECGRRGGHSTKFSYIFREIGNFARVKKGHISASKIVDVDYPHLQIRDVDIRDPHLQFEFWIYPSEIVDISISNCGYPNCGCGLQISIILDISKISGILLLVDISSVLRLSES